MIDTAYHNALRLQQHLKDQLEAARSPSAKVVLSYREMDAKELLMEVKKRFELPLCQKQIDMAIVSEADMTVMADEQLINRVFDNLIENAVRHSPVKSIIQVKATRKGISRVTIRVENAIDTESASGALGMGTKIVEAILSLHQSTLNIELVEGNQFAAEFELSCIAHPTARIHSVPQQWEDDSPAITSTLPHVHVQDAQQKALSGEDLSDSLHVFPQDKGEKKGDNLPSFNALGEASKQTPEDDPHVSSSETKKEGR
ncbi:hypothetical protein AT251_18510 [Enterovibrio nigricans]|nr:HAMP domain-containing sensor histidine kinase [Enterovibrio nigricans]PKF49482.1 hypothetical protein AT251_18510 [Enterovibrio nigricans]